MLTLKLAKHSKTFRAGNSTCASAEPIGYFGPIGYLHDFVGYYSGIINISTSSDIYRKAIVYYDSRPC